MDIAIFNKVLFFWFIFYITPGPVWLAVMAATAKKKLSSNISFFQYISNGQSHRTISTSIFQRGFY